MCDPLTLAGIALTGASAAANTIGHNKASRARDDALAAERIRQQGYDREANALNVQSQDRYKDFSGQQDAKAASLTRFFTDQAPSVDAANASAALPTASNITVAEENRQRQKARDFTNGQAEALGNLRSFGSLFGDIGRAQARDASQIAQIGGFKQGSTAVLPYELDAAKQKGDGMLALGDILGGLGSIATGAGLSRAKPDSVIFTDAAVRAGAPAWAGLRTTGKKTWSDDVRLSPLR